MAAALRHPPSACSGETACTRAWDPAGLFRRGHAGRHFGALWYKIFRERGPC